jgi:uncharacterized repeat protein (TIGR03803 family)
MTGVSQPPQPAGEAKAKVRMLSALISALTVALMLESIPFAHAQSFTTLYSFPRKSVGAFPFAGLIRDTSGTLYGTTRNGGTSGCFPDDGCGTVFKLDKSGNETVLHRFAGLADGKQPTSGLIFDTLGNLYGTTAGGGGKNGKRDGVVFKLDKTGNQTVLYTFSGGTDGALPLAGLVRDVGGNLYGTTFDGGLSDYGVVFKIDRAGKETVLYSFSGGLDGAYPYAGLVLDSTGNLYGVTEAGGNPGCFQNQGCGTVFKIDTKGKKTVYRFGSRMNDGANPYGDLIRDDVGNLYGTTYNGGVAKVCTYGCGTVFKVTPSGHETVLYRFLGGRDGALPMAGLVRDASGALYGTTVVGGLDLCQSTYGDCGTIFKLDSSGKETILYRFMNSNDGANPYGGLIRDDDGNLYGTTSEGGDFNCDPEFGCGTVFKLKP